MAQKKSTASTKKTASGKSAASKSTASKSGKSSGSASSSRKKTAEPAKKPVRREVWGGILLVLTLCTAVSYFGVSAIFIDAFASLIKGLFGCGYYMAAPAMLLAGCILLRHRGRPVQLRVTCALLSPVLFGVLEHMLRCKNEFLSLDGVIPALWKSGKELTSGGVISGAIGEWSVKYFSKFASVILFGALLAVLLVIALRPALDTLREKHRSRPRYEEEDYEEEEEQLSIRPVSRSARSPRRIDIPLDGEVPPAIPAPEKREGRFTGFFRHKSDQQRTPDQVILGIDPAAKAPAAPAAPERKIPEPVFRGSSRAIPTMEPVVIESAEPARPVSRPAPEPMPEPIPEPVFEPVAAEPPRPARPAVPAPTPIVEEKAPRKEKVTTAKEVAAETAAITEEIEKGMEQTEKVYQFPPVELLYAGRGKNYSEAGAELRNNSRRLAETLASFGVDATAGDVVHGPAITRYEFTLDQGVKLSKITNLADDIALALGATGVRIAPIPDKISVVGIEVPNKQVTPVLIRDVIESREFTEHKSNVAFALGRDISGRNVIGNIERLPHVLIAGTTGSGKSVCTNSLIVSLLYKSTPDQVRFIMVDPKMVELAPYNGIPHLLIPVVTDPKKAAGALQWAVFEMMKRYKSFSECGVKKLEEYNRLAKTREDMETLPALVVVIDELADLMLVAAKEVEESICRVAQMGRAAGVHLVIATQRPSADVITGLMKANIPSRIAFAVASSLESRIILDNTGAEKLVGKGDMLYAPLGGGKPTRVQGCFISPEEIEEVVAFVKSSGETNYSDEVIKEIEQSVKEKEKGGKGAAPAPAESTADEGDELLPAAVEVVLETGQASVSMLQRRLKLGYSRAARLVDQMEAQGIVGPFEGSKPRQLLITREQWQEQQMGSVPTEEAAEE